MSDNIIRSFLRGFDKALVICLLEHGPRSGYSLMVELRNLTGGRIGPALIYEFLRDLENNGYLTGRVIKKGRRIREYWLTNKGRGLLRKIRELFRTSLYDMLMEISESR
jgi:DNA-binding PadR family transcriptional regulator